MAGRRGPNRDDMTRRASFHHVDRGSSGTAAERRAELDQLAAQLQRDPRVACAAAVALAARRDERWVVLVGSAGYPELGARSEVMPETPFDLASLTKSFVAATLARLARSGELSLARPLGELLDEARSTPSADLPLELLLAHRAGLEAHRDLFAPLRQHQPFDRAAALGEAARARRKDCAGPLPAGGFEPLYSDLGYALAGAAAERALGSPLDELLERETAEPLGLAVGSARDWLEVDGEFVARVASTEQVAWRGGTLRGLVHDENAWALAGHGLAGHAGLFGTAEAVARFGAALLDALGEHSERWLARQDVETLVRERPGGSLRAGFDGKSPGASAAGARAGPRTFGHLGFTGTSFWCDPDAQVVTVLLTNRVHPTRHGSGIREARPVIHDALLEIASRQ
jgi:serine-type D-Ala-D-Ala carboxypeptidase